MSTECAGADIDQLEHERAEADRDWLSRLVGDWQLIADLSFADLVLWVPDPDAAEQPPTAGQAPAGFRVQAHCRPTTGATLFPRDAVGRTATDSEYPLLARCFSSEQVILGEEDDSLFSRAEIVPVVRAGRVLAVLTRHTDSARRIGISRLERNYRASASALLEMIGEGSFPRTEALSRARRGEPRVGDGIVVLNREGRVRYVSPNGVSVLYRLGHAGEIEGRYLAELVTATMDQSENVVDEALPLVLTGREGWRADIDTGRVSVALRSIPLEREGNRTGAILLLRDVSEVRRRERQLLSRDAMIREMHHRVKNNLQTVSALLRMQSRRTDSAEAKAAIGEAMRRVSAIAVVHDSLSQAPDESVSFDKVVDQGLRFVPQLASPDSHVRVQRTASFGKIASADATSLLLALVELVSNAVEHAFTVPERHEREPEREPIADPWIEVVPQREGNRLHLQVCDNGYGLSAERGPGDGLGTQIVRTLVTSDLRGTIEWQPREGGGTCVWVDVPLRPVKK